MRLATLFGLYLLLTTAMVFGGYYARVWVKSRCRPKTGWVKVR